MRPSPIVIRFIPVHDWTAFNLNVDEPTLHPRQASLNEGHSTIRSTYSEERDYQGVWDRHNPVENTQHDSHPRGLHSPRKRRIEQLQVHRLAVHEQFTENQTLRAMLTANKT